MAKILLLASLAVAAVTNALAGAGGIEVNNQPPSLKSRKVYPFVLVKDYGDVVGMSCESPSHCHIATTRGVSTFGFDAGAPEPALPTPMRLPTNDTRASIASVQLYATAGSEGMGIVVATIPHNSSFTEMRLWHRTGELSLSDCRLPPSMPPLQWRNGKHTSAVASTGGKGIFAISGTNAVYSTNGGSSFQSTNIASALGQLGLTVPKADDALFVQMPHDRAWLLTAWSRDTDDKTTYIVKTSDNGNTYKRVHAIAAVAERNVHGMVCGRSNRYDFCYIAKVAGATVSIIATTDYGESWKEIYKFLDNPLTHSFGGIVATTNYNSQGYFVAFATRTAVHYSRDAGEKWESVSLGNIDNYAYEFPTNLNIVIDRQLVAIVLTAKRVGSSSSSVIELTL